MIYGVVEWNCTDPIEDDDAEPCGHEKADGWLCECWQELGCIRE